MSYTPVTVADFKTFFARDFPYGLTVETVMDADITKALGTAGINFNECLWGTQEGFFQAYLYLTAHFLVVSIRASSGGLNGQYAGNTTSKSVGTVSESYVLPERIQNSPFLSSLYTTSYGAQYGQLISLRLVGHVMTLVGATTP